MNSRTDLYYKKFLDTVKKTKNGTKNELEVYLEALKGFNINHFTDESLINLKNTLSKLVLKNKDSIVKKEIMLAICSALTILSLSCGIFVFSGVIMKLLSIALVSGLGLVAIMPLVKELRKNKNATKRAKHTVNQASEILDFSAKRQQAIDVSYEIVPEQTVVEEKLDFREMLKLIIYNLGKLPEDLSRSYNIKLQTIYIKYGKTLNRNRKQAFTELKNLCDEMIELITSLNSNEVNNPYVRKRQVG